MSNILGDLKRTHNCNDLREKHAGQEVVLMGWVQSGAIMEA